MLSLVSYVFTERNKVTNARPTQSGAPAILIMTRDGQVFSLVWRKTSPGVNFYQHLMTASHCGTSRGYWSSPYVQCYGDECDTCASQEVHVEPKYSRGVHLETEGYTGRPKELVLSGQCQNPDTAEWRTKKCVRTQVPQRDMPTPGPCQSMYTKEEHATRRNVPRCQCQDTSATKVHVPEPIQGRAHHKGLCRNTWIKMWVL